MLWKLHLMSIWNLLKEWHYCLRAANSSSSTLSVRAPFLVEMNHLATAVSQLLHGFSFSDGILVCSSRNWGEESMCRKQTLSQRTALTGVAVIFQAWLVLSHFTGQNVFLFSFKSLGEFLLNPWMGLCSAGSRSGHSSTPLSICSTPGRQHWGERQHRLTAPTCVPQQHL